MTIRSRSLPVRSLSLIWVLSRSSPWVEGTKEPRSYGCYVDVDALLDGGLPEQPSPSILRRTDGVGLFYAGQVNVIFGDPEAGKTLLVTAAAAEALTAGQRVLWIDIDHNGPAATVARLREFGAPEQALRNLDVFRYAEPEGTQARLCTEEATYVPSGYIDETGRSSLYNA